MLPYVEEIAILLTFTLLSFSCQVNGKNSDVDREKFKEQNLLCHNKYREKHGVKPLSYNDQLHKVAQEYAEFLAEQDEGLVHSSNEFGENLYGSRGIKLDGLIACDSWYDEIKLYSFNDDQPTNIKEVGHFTQMIWKGTCFMGVGFATAESGWTYVVANYDPIGNVDMKFRTNVLPLGTKAKLNKTLSPFEELISEEVVMCSDADDETFLEQNLKCHNIIRKRHGVEPLVYDELMNELAQKEAESLTDDDQDKSSTRKSEYGRNVFSSSSGMKNGYDACKYWYKGNELYDYNSDNITSKALAFTQMVWKSSRNTGIGFARSSEGSIFYVGFYDPPGNYLGDFKANVLPPQADITPTMPDDILMKPNIREKIPEKPLEHSTEKTPTKDKDMDKPPLEHQTAKPPIIEQKPPIIHKPATDTTIYALGTTTLKPLVPIKTKVTKVDSTKLFDHSGNLIEIESFRNQNIECHNELRRNHDAAPLSYDSKLNSLAQEIATQVAQTGDKKKLRNASHGYNLYSTTRQKVNGTIACAFWYKRSPYKDSQNKTLTPSKEILPFTQMVWKLSRRTGIGISKASTGKIHIVALYDPPGNIDGLYKYNVSPPYPKKS